MANLEIDKQAVYIENSHCCMKSLLLKIPSKISISSFSQGDYIEEKRLQTTFLDQIAQFFLLFSLTYLVLFF